MPELKFQSSLAVNSPVIPGFFRFQQVFRYNCLQKGTTTMKKTMKIFAALILAVFLGLSGCGGSGGSGGTGTGTGLSGSAQ